MKIAIQGHPDRGKEVIQILESLDGENRYDQSGNNEKFVYFINSIGFINSVTQLMCSSERKVYTLEEFEKEFPFKIGDKVTIIGLPYFPKIITKMVWDCDEILYSFEGLNNTWFGAKALKKFEMKEERNITLSFNKAKEWYKKGGELKKIALQAFSEKELIEVELPESWEEFCDNYSTKNGECYIGACSEMHILPEFDEGRDVERDKNVCPSQKSAEAHLAMIQLEQLRDCYRGLFITVIGMPVWCIRRWKGELVLDQRVWGTNETFLTFQSKEVAEKYLKNFKPLIEKAGDLIS